MATKRRTKARHVVCDVCGETETRHFAPRAGETRACGACRVRATKLELERGGRSEKVLPGETIDEAIDRLMAERGW